MLPHTNTPVYAAGEAVERAAGALILLHGRGANAQDILALAAPLDVPGLAYLAPQAEGYTWYPNRFVAPLAANEPQLSAALARITELVRDLQARDLPLERIFIGGFSQGACLACEYVLRNPQAYGGLIGFSGGYIGPLGTVREPAGALGGMPAFLGCSDVDPHIPLQRVHETTALLTAMGARVAERIYPGMEHTIVEDEIEQARVLIASRL